MTGLAAIIFSLTSVVFAQTTSAPAEPTPVTTTSAPAAPEPAALAVLSSLIEAELHLDRTDLPVGSPVMAEFTIRNKTLDPVTLQVPGAEVSHKPLEAVGLPLEHVFSGERFRAVRIVAEMNPALGDRYAITPAAPVPLLTLAPLGSTGLKFDLARLYPVLHQAGKYELTWMPYGGAVASAPVVLTVSVFKVVVLETPQGKLTLRLLYDKAPKTVANFIDLVTSRFYDGKSFHRLEPNFVLAGGCPRGDGTGRRPDGRTVEPEFNDTPFDFGTVGMSLTPGDPRSASCQFFISLSRIKPLDGKYTAFAQIEGPESAETLRKLGTVEVDRADKPVQPLTIKNAVLMEASTVH